MEKIKHHLTEDLLMGYAAGSLPEAFNLVVATHISMCDECRAALAEYDAIGGELLLSEDVAMLSNSSIEDTLARIEGLAQERPAATQPAGSRIFPTPLQSYVGGDLNEVKWRRIGGGVSQMVLRAGKTASVRLLRIPGGSAVPDHGHNGTELTLVLQGAFRDEEDSFSAGDIEIANEDLTHTPIAEEGMDCICLAATDAPLQFNGLLPRIAQRFMGI